MKHHVAPQDVAPGLGLHLGVDGVACAVDLAEDVEDFEAEVEHARYEDGILRLELPKKDLRAVQSPSRIAIG